MSDLMNSTDQVGNRLKRGGAYNQQERTQRRERVYEMHFVQHITATHIAEILGVNRNTINSDIAYLYEECAEHWDRTDVVELLQRQMNRLDSQRCILLSELDRTSDLKQRLAIQKLILEIDNKITHIALNVYNAELWL